MPLKWVYYGLMFLCVITLVWNRNRLDKKHLLFLPIVVIAITTQLLAEVIEKEDRSHYFLFHLYIPLEYLLLSLYYYYLFRVKLVKWLLVFTNVVLFTFCIVHYYLGKNFWLPDFSDFALGAAFNSLLVIAFFVSLFRKEEVVLMRYPDFWINTGNLLFYAGCLFVMGLYHSLHQKDEKLAEQLMDINHYLNLVLYLFYFIAFLCPRTKMISLK